MSPAWRLALVRGVHTAIYVVMAAASIALLYAGVTGARGAWVWVALGLVAVESVVFLANGLKCPLTAVAMRYGADGRTVGDTFLPERITRHTFAVFGPLIALAFGLLAIRWLA